ncbi:MAG: helix-turn-helix domain-containing protein [Acidimicrobiia bacterium]
MAKQAATNGDRGATTRAALVQSATDLFVEKGYGAVSVRDLARRTGLTTGAIYGHYRNKAALLVAAIDDRIEAELEGPSHRTSKARTFRESIGHQWRNYRSRSAMRALLVEGAAAARVDDEVRNDLAALLDGRLDEWRVIYHDLQVSEKMDPDADMETVMVMLFAAELGLGMLESIGVDLPKPSAWERTVERLLSTVYPARRR